MTITCQTTAVARPPLSRIFSRLKARFARRREHRINRNAFQTMLKLDDARLKDIGVTRSDVLWASRLPLSENAALELRKASLKP